MTKPLQILFTGEAIGVIEKLMKNSGSSSKAEVVRDAISLYEILDGISKGKNIIVRLEGSNEERIITLPKKKPTVMSSTNLVKN